MSTSSAEVVELASALMRCPSISPQDQDCQKIVAAFLSTMGFECESLPFGPVKNLWAKRGSGSPLVVFLGHTDVVPPGPAEKWTSPAFSPEVRGDYLYGRGAVDMKGAVAAMCIAAAQWLAQHPNYAGSLAFLLTSDEESDAINGTYKAIQALHARGEKIDYCIVGEPSSYQHIGDRIRVGRRGSLHGTLTVYGKQGHVATPELTQNPIHHSLLFLHQLAQTEWDKGHGPFPPTSFQITEMQSGTGARNIVPGELRAYFNFRFSTAWSVEKLQERVEELASQLDIRYEIEWKIGALPFLSQTGKLITTTQSVIKEVTGLDAELSCGGGTSDARFLAPLGIEIVELGLINATAHHVNECTRVEDLVTLVGLYQKLLGKLLL